MAKNLYYGFHQKKMGEEGQPDSRLANLNSFRRLGMWGLFSVVWYLALGDQGRGTVS